MDGKTALGASSLAKPALHIPEPLSTTKAATSSSHSALAFYTGSYSVAPWDDTIVSVNIL